MSKVIAFDTWALQSRFRYSGIFGYTKGLLRQFRDQAQHAGVQVISFVATGYPNDAVEFSSTAGFTSIECPQLAHSTRWKLGEVTRSARRNGAHVLFCPAAEVLPYPLIPVVTTIHDLTPFTAPSFSPITNMRVKLMMWIAARGSRLIITDSECSKHDLVNILGVAPERVRVVYLGYKREVFNASPTEPAAIDNIRRHHGLDRPYIIHHGTIQPRKNLERLIAAYQLVLERNPSATLDLLLVGAYGWQYEGIIATARRCTRGRVVFAGPVVDADLALLLKGAELSVIPSLYEGFCYPMIESMACGVPTVVSSSSCLPEISGGVLSYFDPLDIGAIADSIETGLCDSTLREQLRTRGLARATQFTWERCGRETLDALKSAA